MRLTGSPETSSSKQKKVGGSSESLRERGQNGVDSLEKAKMLQMHWENETGGERAEEGRGSEDKAKEEEEAEDCSISRAFDCSFVQRRSKSCEMES